MADISFKNNKELYRQIRRTGLPSAVQNIIGSSMLLIDSVMIGALGESELAAVGMANKLSFLFLLCCFGISTGVSVLTAQYWGKKDFEGIKKMTGFLICFVSFLSLFFSLLGIMFSEEILELFSKDLKTVSMGADYLRIIGFSYFFTGISVSLGITLRNIEKAKVPMKISSFAMIINTAMNYMLIYGKIGFPQMGVRGAAIATLVSKIIECAFFLIYIKKKNLIIFGKKEIMFRHSRQLRARIFKIAGPVFFNEMFWALGFSTYAVIYGKLGVSSFAAYQISDIINQFFFVISISLGSAAMVIIGKEIGSQRKDNAYIIAQKFTKLIFLTGFILGTLLIAGRPLILKLFTLSPTGYDYSMKMLIIYGLTMPFRSYNGLLIIGILRGGGDTKFAMILEMVSIWMLGVPAAFIGAVILRLPVYGVAVLIASEDIIKAITGIRRVKSGKWINDVVEDISVVQ